MHLKMLLRQPPRTDNKYNSISNVQCLIKTALNATPYAPTAYQDD